MNCSWYNGNTRVFSLTWSMELVLVAADKISFIIPLHQLRAARLEAGKLI